MTPKTSFDKATKLMLLMQPAGAPTLASFASDIKREGLTVQMRSEVLAEHERAQLLQPFLQHNAFMLGIWRTTQQKNLVLKGRAQNQNAKAAIRVLTLRLVTLSERRSR